MCRDIAPPAKPRSAPDQLMPLAKSSLMHLQHRTRMSPLSQLCLPLALCVTPCRTQRMQAYGPNDRTGAGAPKFRWYACAVSSPDHSLECARPTHHLTPSASACKHGPRTEYDVAFCAPPTAASPRTRGPRHLPRCASSPNDPPHRSNSPPNWVSARYSPKYPRHLGAHQGPDCSLHQGLLRAIQRPPMHRARTVHT